MRKVPREARNEGRKRGGDEEGPLCLERYVREVRNQNVPDSRKEKVGLLIRNKKIPSVFYRGEGF